MRDVREHLELEDDEPIPEWAAEELEPVLSCDNEHDASSAAYDFDGKAANLQDFWENNCHQFTFRFLWCCHALVWAIKKYAGVSK